MWNEQLIMTLILNTISPPGTTLSPLKETQSVYMHPEVCTSSAEYAYGTWLRVMQYEIVSHSFSLTLHFIVHIACTALI